MSDSKSIASGKGSHEPEHDYSAGLAVVAPDKVADPGLEPHRVRMTDKSVKHEKAAARQVSAMFLVSVLGSIFSIYAYFAFPLSDDLGTVRNNTLFMGLGITLGLFGIGFGAVHWAKTLMPDAEVSEARHQTRGTEDVRARAIEIIKLADSESGFSRRKLIRRSLYGALAVFPLPAIMIFGDLGQHLDDLIKSIGCDQTLNTPTNLVWRPAQTYT